MIVSTHEDEAWTTADGKHGHEVDEEGLTSPVKEEEAPEEAPGGPGNTPFAAKMELLE